MTRTHGQMWADKVHARVAGYCKARGWRCGELFTIANATMIHSQQRMVEIRDAFGNRAEVVTVNGIFLDECGRSVDVSADAFDELVAPYGLVRRVPVSKRQLSFAWIEA